VNPSPGFTYYQAATKQPIGEAIAQLLIAGSRDSVFGDTVWPLGVSLVLSQICFKQDLRDQDKAGAKHTTWQGYRKNKRPFLGKRKVLKTQPVVNYNSPRFKNENGDPNEPIC
jgi:hypothetical protein